MAKGAKRRKASEVTVNGIRVDVLESVLTHGGETPNTGISLTLRVGTGAAPALFLIGSRVNVDLESGSPSTFRVVGIEEVARDDQMTYEIRLRQVPPPPDLVSMTYGSAVQAVMNQIRLQALIDLLESRGLADSAEYESKVADVAERFVLQFAAEVVSPADALAMRDYVLASLAQGTTSSAPGG